MPHNAVFLDRDGTLIEEAHYLAAPEQVRLIPGAAAAVRRLNDAGVKVVVVTNQAGVARGFFPESRVAEIHAHLTAVLAAAGATIDAFYYCPHHPTAGTGEFLTDCTCRKPSPGMLLAAARDLDIDLSRSWMVGDNSSDLGAGAAAGCRTVLVRTGYGAGVAAGPLAADALRLAGIVDDLPAAIDLWATWAPGEREPEAPE